MLTLDAVAQINRWRTRSVTEKSALALGMLGLALGLPPLPTAPLIIALMAAAAILGAGVPVRLWAAACAGPLGFLAMGLLPLAFDDPALAAGMAMRSFAAVTCLVFLGLTTPAPDIVRALRKIGLPVEIADIALLTYRLLFLFSDTAMSMHRAQAARLGTVGLRRRLRSLGLLLANLLPRAFARAARMDMGLQARGWRGEMPVLTALHPVSRLGLASVAILEIGVALVGVRLS